MQDIVVPNNQVEIALDLWVDDQLEGGTLRLFQNDFTPDPASEVSDFVEATFGGYAAQALSGTFGPTYKVEDGEYQRDTSALPFSCSGAPDNDVYGFWVDVGSSPGDIRASGRFPSSIPVTNGTIFSVTFSPQGWSLSIIP